MKRVTKILIHILVIVLLTLLTQVGGVIWLLSLFISHKINRKKRIIFPVLYLVFNMLIIPPAAKLFGREQLPIISKQLKPRNLIYPLLYRNYVNPELKSLLETASEQLKYSGLAITYLDANFPFFDGFPLLPHLSHNDGKKIDISFMYLDNEGNSTDKKPSLSGYGIYVNKSNQTSTSCIKKGYWQYDFPKYLTFGTFNKLDFDINNTTLLLNVFLNNPKTEKIFIEPYLKESMGFSNTSKIRFHGCGAVRHDDHIHLQIK